jgi:ectoine hydroxylase-related dioxygenase (phytanoyl-CoA dioxygenase family)
MGSLSQEQVRQFEEQGYLLVRDLLDPEQDLDPVIKEYEGVLDRLIDRLIDKGEIASRYEELPFGKRVIAIQNETGRGLVQHFDFSLPKVNITTETPFWVGEAVFNVLSNPRMLDAIESLIGPEIFVNPVHHVRMKLPESAISAGMRNDLQVNKTPWHQDNGVVTEEADQTNMVTVWFPLWDTPISSGPLQIAPGSHRSGLLTHCPNGKAGVAIPDKLLDYMPLLSLPMKRGDALFFQKLTAHCSLPNQSDTIRWSFDLRYQPVGQPTGRDAFPGFIARSRKSPESELHDAKEWANRWFETRARLAVNGPLKKFSRWKADAALCA